MTPRLKRKLAEHGIELPPETTIKEANRVLCAAIERAPKTSAEERVKATWEQKVRDGQAPADWSQPGDEEK